jgi:O-antigen/teichoic acid export membrane protein
VQQSYTRNYIQIYLWQGISIALNFLALFVVIPNLSSRPAIYGIYSVCIGFAIFFSYADIGFVSAGIKYASEAYARNDRMEEQRIIGFSSFLLTAILLLIFFFFIYCSFNPSFIIKGIVSDEEQKIASYLLLVLACSIPVYIIQRVVQMIFLVRVQEYIVQRINIVGSLIRIASVFVFFADSYNIVEYYIFTQVVLLAVSFVSCFIAHKIYDYNFGKLLSYFRFNGVVFDKMKKLAFGSLFTTIMWIIYYELDSLVIGKFFGAEKLAVYAIGLNLLSFCRGILGTAYGPFMARFNHFIGTNNQEGLRTFVIYLMKIFSPFIFLSLICLSFMIDPFILSWVGVNYKSSIPIARWLLLCNLFAFISYPGATLLSALERLKEIYIISLLSPLVYWGGILLFYPRYGLTVFAVFKCIAFFIPALFYINFSIKYLNISFLSFVRQIFTPLIVPSGVLLTLSFIIKPYLPIEKSVQNLFITLMAIVLIILSGIMAQLFFSKELREKIRSMIVLIKRG